MSLLVQAGAAVLGKSDRGNRVKEEKCSCGLDTESELRLGRTREGERARDLEGGRDAQGTAGLQRSGRRAVTSLKGGTGTRGAAAPRASVQA